MMSKSRPKSIWTLICLFYKYTDPTRSPIEKQYTPSQMWGAFTVRIIDT